MPALPRAESCAPRLQELRLLRREGSRRAERSQGLSEQRSKADSVSHVRFLSIFLIIGALREGGLPSEGLPRRQDGGVVKPDVAAEGAIPHIHQNQKFIREKIMDKTAFYDLSYGV